MNNEPFCFLYKKCGLVLLNGHIQKAQLKYMYTTIEKLLKVHK